MGLSSFGSVGGATGASLELTPSVGVTCSAPTVAGSTDVLIYTVPASPTGPNRRVLTGLVLRLSVALVGSGSVVLTAGTTAGGTDLITAQTILAATAVGADYGLVTASLGTAFESANGYNAKLAAGATVYVRLVTAGTVSTAPILIAHAYGMAL